MVTVVLSRLKLIISRVPWIRFPPSRPMLQACTDSALKASHGTLDSRPAQPADRSPFPLPDGDTEIFSTPWARTGAES